MAVSQVLIVNIWEQAVGLYNGANLGLLKTVLEVHMQLFQRKGAAKTLLLFVIRDFIGKTPLTSLSNTLLQDMNKIWLGLSKPEEFEGVPMTDCFDIKFYGLPHKILMEEKFNEEAAKLSNWYDVD